MFLSSLGTVLRIFTTLCIVAGAVTVIITARLYNARYLYDSANVTKFYEVVDGTIDYKQSLIVTIAATFISFIGWEAIHSRNTLFMHVFAWGMLTLAIVMLLYTSARYSGERTLERDKLYDILFEKWTTWTRQQNKHYVHKVGEMTDIFAIPYIRQINILQKSLHCCGKILRESDYRFLFNTYHGKYQDLPHTCCRDGFYRKRCKWGENFSKGCPEAIRRWFRRITSFCRIALFCYTFFLLCCAIWGISCVLFLHCLGYKMKVNFVRESYKTRAYRTFGVREVTEEDREIQRQKEMERMNTAKESDDDSDSDDEILRHEREREERERQERERRAKRDAVHVHMRDPKPKERRDDKPENIQMMESIREDRENREKDKDRLRSRKGQR